MKERIFERIVDIEGEGYSTEANSDFKGPNISDLVYVIVLPINYGC